jgi:eukaryotic-like serine/threonine-protein kinase
VLKLVAGLLGVGYDDLARRDAQQRQRRMAYITMAALAGMTVAIGLAATAVIARDDAQRRQAQAEDILDFMLGDLRKKLTQVGRLDLMRSVDDKATGYFATLDPRDLSDRTLETQARSLTGIGEVRLKEGNHREAMTAFREAHARSTALYERAPEQGQRLFDLAQTEYWIGFVAWRQGNYDQAGFWLGRYRDKGIKLAALDRNNLAWQKEQAYGYQNLAVLNHSQGNFDVAIGHMTSVRNLYADWLKKFPDDLQLRFEDANNASWLGNIALVQGNLALAESYYSQNHDAIAENLRRDANNSTWQSQRLDSLLLLLDSQVRLGKYELARAHSATALKAAEVLTQHDRSNNGWQMSLGVARYWQAALAAEHQMALAADSVATLKRAHAIEPKNERISRWLVRALLLQGQLKLKASEVAGVADNVRQARALIEPFWQSKPNEQMRTSKVQTLILEAELLLKMHQRPAAEAVLNDALKLLYENQSQGLLFGRLDDAVRVLSLLGQEGRAEQYKEKLAAAGFVGLPR